MPVANPLAPQGSHCIGFDEDRSMFDSPCVFPIPVNDFGRATSPTFQMHILELFKDHNIVGIISCGTADTNIGLAEAVRFIDVPVLLVLDSTLDGPELFIPNARELITGKMHKNEANAEQLVPNALQLIPNNALQAQAILSKVGVLSTNRPNPVVQLLCFPPDDPYVKDLRSAVESNVEETNRSKISPELVDITRFQVKKNAVLLCLGYYETLAAIPKSIKNCQLLLSDGFDERAAKSEKIEVGHYYQISPVFDPLEHALDAYKVVNRLWRDSQDLNPDDLPIRLRSKIQNVRELLEREYGDRYRFVGATNQRGGFYAKKVPMRRRRRFLPDPRQRL
ncbi:MAG TPA: hypothetical protein VNO50_09160 [Pyrinomonadaceae bacterium]|nr:hypothetical protein [Pyrinomonadaceae bacterium]